MKHVSLIVGALIGFLSFVWATTTMNISESFGLGIIVGTAVEWLVAFYKERFSNNNRGSKEQALRISQTLRELQEENK